MITPSALMIDRGERPSKEKPLGQDRKSTHTRFSHDEEEGMKRRCQRTRTGCFESGGRAIILFGSGASTDDYSQRCWIWARSPRRSISWFTDVRV